jgi:hypothetical protein
MKLESRIEAAKAEISLLEAAKQAIEEALEASKQKLSMLQDVQRSIMNAGLDLDRAFD